MTLRVGFPCATVVPDNSIDRMVTRLAYSRPFYEASLSGGYWVMLEPPGTRMATRLAAIPGSLPRMAPTDALVPRMCIARGVESVERITWFGAPEADA